MTRSITFEFDLKTGEAVAETKGIHGQSCEEALKKFKLGEVTKTKKTGDYYRPGERSDLISKKIKV